MCVVSNIWIKCDFYGVQSETCAWDPDYSSLQSKGYQTLVCGASNKTITWRNCRFWGPHLIPFRIQTFMGLEIFTLNKQFWWFFSTSWREDWVFALLSRILTRENQPLKGICWCRERCLKWEVGLQKDQVTDFYNERVQRNEFRNYFRGLRPFNWGKWHCLSKWLAPGSIRTHCTVKQFMLMWQVNI